MAIDIQPIRFALSQIEKEHSPMRGEAYPADKTKYCSVCMSSDGGSKKWPCRTVKLIRDAMIVIEDSEAGEGKVRG